MNNIRDLTKQIKMVFVKQMKVTPKTTTFTTQKKCVVLIEDYHTHYTENIANSTPKLKLNTVCEYNSQF